VHNNGRHKPQISLPLSLVTPAVAGPLTVHRCLWILAESRHHDWLRNSQCGSTHAGAGWQPVPILRSKLLLPDGAQDSQMNTPPSLSRGSAPGTLRIASLARSGCPPNADERRRSGPEARGDGCAGRHASSWSHRGPHLGIQRRQGVECAPDRTRYGTASRQD